MYRPPSSLVGIATSDQRKTPRNRGFSHYGGCQNGRVHFSTVITYSFENLGAHRVFLEILESNIASRSLCEAVGFRQEGVYRDGYRDESGRFHNLIPYGLLKTDSSP